MNKHIYLPVVLTLSLIISPLTSTQAVESVVTDMQEAAASFLDSLTTELKARATFPLDDEEERINWHFVPKTGERKGVDLKDLNEEQETKLQALLAASLSAQGQEKVANIQDLESVLFIMENKDHRDPELYYTTIFGEPTAGGTWGWRFEGHHLSLNFTVVNGKLLANSPNFWGANPATVPVGPTTGLRTLKAEEDMAREFVQSLNKEQKAVAIIADEAPRDIYTSANKTSDPLSPQGLLLSAMDPEQKRALRNLIFEYVNNMPQGVAEARRQELAEAGIDNISFVWAGPIEKGGKHYYRIQGPTFLIEYDNIQNEGNHIHAVWRDFDGDFGRDILAEHHKQHH
jgi:hypothetical protein